MPYACKMKTSWERPNVFIIKDLPSNVKLRDLQALTIYEIYIAEDN